MASSGEMNVIAVVCAEETTPGTALLFVDKMPDKSRAMFLIGPGDTPVVAYDGNQQYMLEWSYEMTADDQDRKFMKTYRLLSPLPIDDNSKLDLDEAVSRYLRGL